MIVEITPQGVQVMKSQQPPPGVLADLKLYYAVGRDLATSADWPNWVEGDEFRGIRDKDRAGQ